MASSLPPVRIIFWTRWFNSLMFDGNDKNIGDECPVPEGFVFNISSGEPWCTITPDLNNPEDASALLFHAADYAPSQVPRRIDNQPWILETQESPITASFRTNEGLMEPFDFLASYHLKSDFLFTYFSPYVYEVANRPLPDDFMKKKTTRAPILWIAKNCYATSGRQTYVAELMKYIKVDSYGPCLNNMEFTENLTRTDLMAEYKFYLAIENANCDDYVTEKLFDTLVLSTVPIVDGPDSYDSFLPNSKAGIRMDKYPDPRDLAAYIDYLDKNDTAYLEHLSHQRDAQTLPAKERLSPAFIDNWRDYGLHTNRSDWCSVCRGVAPIWRGRVEPYYTYVPAVERKDRFLIDRSCNKPGKWDYASSGPPYIAPWAQVPHEGVDSVQLGGDSTHGEVVGDQVWSILSIWKLEIVICVLFLSFIASMLYKRHMFICLQQRSSLPK